MRPYRIIINGLFILSFILIIWINFLENYYITTLEWIDYKKLNSLIESISIAYLTSFIFYIVVIVLKTNQDKKIILPFVADYTYVAMNNCMFFCSSMRSFAGLKYIQLETSIYNRELKIYPSQEDLKIICSKNPNAVIYGDIDIDGLSIIPHFFGIMINYTYRIDYFLKIILEKSIFLDMELLKILTDIQTHGYHQNMLSYEKKTVLTAKHRHDNLNVFEKSFQSYFELFLKLEKYSEKHLKKYVER